MCNQVRYDDRLVFLAMLPKNGNVDNECLNSRKGPEKCAKPYSVVSSYQIACHLRALSRVKRNVSQTSLAMDAVTVELASLFDTQRLSFKSTDSFNMCPR